MNPDRWQLPDAPLRASAVTSTLAGLAALVAVATIARLKLPLGDRYPLKAAALFAVIMALSIGRLRQHHPFARFGGANQITTLRAILVVLVAGLIGERRDPSVAIAAGIASPFGARFDMEIDALLILALSLLAWRYGKAGRWVIASGLLRYVFVAAGAILPWLRAALRPSRRRQTICVVQVAALTLVMLPAIEPPASVILAGGALAALAGSFLIDTLWLWRHAA